MKPNPDKFTIWHGLLLGEGFTLLVALATTVVPSKTGSRFGIAGHFFDEPTFWQEFLVNLVFVHATFLLIAAVVAVWWWTIGSRRSKDAH